MVGLETFILTCIASPIQQSASSAHLDERGCQCKVKLMVVPSCTSLVTQIALLLTNHEAICSFWMWSVSFQGAWPEAMVAFTRALR